MTSARDYLTRRPAPYTRNGPVEIKVGMRAPQQESEMGVSVVECPRHEKEEKEK